MALAETAALELTELYPFFTLSAQQFMSIFILILSFLIFPFLWIHKGIWLMEYIRLFGLEEIKFLVDSNQVSDINLRQLRKI